MKHTSLILILILIFFGSGELSGQETWEKILSFPNAAELGSFGRSPVGYFTGTNQVNIPIYEFKTRNLSYPISLNYSTNGFKVDKVASKVGFDWTISEGVITRIVRGIPDDYKPIIQYPVDLDPIHYCCLSQQESEAERSFYNDYALGTHTEPDIFSFNFNGYSGQFYIDYSNQNSIVLVPFQDLKVDFIAEGFKFTDAKGIQYEFGKGEVSTTDGGHTITKSSYYLTKIIHPTGESIIFNYIKDDLISPDTEYKTSISDNVTLGVVQGFDPPCTPFFDPGGPNLPIANTSTIFGFYARLSSISASGYGKVEFHYMDDRLDFMEHRLDHLVILDEKGAVIRSVSFHQHYPNTNLFDNTGSYTNVGSLRDNVRYRMYLDSVVIKDSQGLKKQKYSFEYNNLDQLPVRLSYSQDHWGYFNGASNSTLLPDQIPSGIKQTYFSNLYGRMSADRNANYLYSQKGILKKIIFPTGGYTTYEYEAHRCDNNPNEEIGGVRLKKQNSFSEDNKLAYTTTYTYSGGSRGNFNIEYYFSKVVSKSCNDLPLFDCHQLIQTYELRSTPIYPLSSSGGIDIGYKNVTVYSGNDTQNAGKVEYEFEIEHDRYEHPMIGQISFPCPVSNFGWKNGTKLLEKYYKNESGIYTPVKEIVYKYKEDESNSISNYYPVIQNDDFEYSGLGTEAIYAHFDVFVYEIMSKWRYLSTKVEKTFSENGQVKIVDSINYIYGNPTHAQLTREESINSSGDIQRTQYKYPDDYYSTFYNLTSKHIISSPIETRRYLNNTFIDGQQISYNNLGQPIEIFKAQLTTSDTTIMPLNPFTFTNYASIQYDLNNNTRQISKYNDFATSYLWGYNNTLPIAEVKNATIDKVAFTGFESLNEGTWSYSSGTLMYNSTARTGDNYYNFSGNDISKSVTPGTFILEYWAKSPITVSGGTITNIYSSSPDSKGWMHYKKKIVTASIITLSLSAGTTTSIDELRLYPIDAEMTSFSYKPLVGMTSKTDPNGVTTFYEYDSFNRLEYIKDDGHNILKHIKYHYKTQTGN